MAIGQCRVWNYGCLYKLGPSLRDDLPDGRYRVTPDTGRVRNREEQLAPARGACREQLDNLGGVLGYGKIALPDRDAGLMRCGGSQGRGSDRQDDECCYRDSLDQPDPAV